MSEYQHYEFVAIDRRLTAREQQELRAISSRATITATRFSNSYSYGNLKADASELQDRYFDAHLYLANWGTRVLSFRFPKQVVRAAEAKRTCAGGAASVRTRGAHLTLEFRSEEEEGDWIEDDEGTEHLAALLPLRAEIAGGDHRALYLGWLLRLQSDELSDDEEEPPCPPGLRDLSAPLAALAEFLRIDEDLLAAAAEASPGLSEPGRGEIEGWLESLPASEQARLLADFVEGAAPLLRSTILRRVKASAPSEDGRRTPRTVGQLLAQVDRIRDERQRAGAEQAARERARKERAAAEARGRELDGLAVREAKAWAEVDALVAAGTPARYDEAAKLLRDLRDLGARRGDVATVATRIDQLCAQHQRKSGFVRRVRAALGEVKGVRATIESEPTGLIPSRRREG